MAREQFLKIRIAPEELERFQRAASMKKMSLSRLVRDTMTHVTDRILAGDVVPKESSESVSAPMSGKEVSTSKPVQEVSKKVQPTPSRKPTLTELMQPGQKHWEAYRKAAQETSPEDFVDYLTGDVEFIDDRPAWRRVRREDG